MYIVAYRKIFYIVSGILVALSFLGIFTWGLNLGVDFKGGSVLEVEYKDARPAVEVVDAKVANLSLSHTIRSTGDKGFILKTKILDEPSRLALMKALAVNGAEPETKRLSTVGPLLGSESARKSAVSIVLAIICIVLFITFAFRKVSKPVASWKYGVIAVLALVHDVIVPTGVFVVLGHFGGVEVDTLFVTALLVILGFSIHDTIVVFDRVRENLRINEDHRDRKPFDQIVGEGINQTFIRSINTSLTTVLALVVLYFFGAEATKYFSLALIVGIIAGTYSSVFIASPLLVTVEKWQNKKVK